MKQMIKFVDKQTKISKWIEIEGTNSLTLELCHKIQDVIEDYKKEDPDYTINDIAFEIGAYLSTMGYRITRIREDYKFEV